MDGGAWSATVRWVMKSQTQLTQLNSSRNIFEFKETLSNYIVGIFKIYHEKSYTPCSPLL